MFGYIFKTMLLPLTKGSIVIGWRVAYANIFDKEKRLARSQIFRRLDTITDNFEEDGSGKICLILCDDNTFDTVRVPLYISNTAYADHHGGMARSP